MIEFLGGLGGKKDRPIPHGDRPSGTGCRVAFFRRFSTVERNVFVTLPAGLLVGFLCFLRRVVCFFPVTILCNTREKNCDYRSNEDDDEVEDNPANGFHPVRADNRPHSKNMVAIAMTTSDTFRSDRLFSASDSQDDFPMFHVAVPKLAAARIVRTTPNIIVVFQRKKKQRHCVRVVDSFPLHTLHTTR